jgi:hypothetical protein
VGGITERKEQHMYSTLRRAVAFTAVLTTVLLALGPLTGAAASVQKCAATKLKAAGKEVRAKMLCYARAKNAAAPVDATCLTKAQTKADVTINTADGACGGAASDIDAAVDGCVSAFLTDDPGNGACPARSARAIANGVKGELECQARDVTRPGAFTTCDATEDGKTTTGLRNAGGGTPCANVTAVMADIDSCDTAIDVLGLTTNTPCSPDFQSVTCGGTCPSGQVCTVQCLDFGCFTCACVPTCLISDAPTCGGTCPPGQMCGEASGGNSCVCVTADDTCAISQAPACGGTCPNGQICGQRSGAASCECVNPDNTCAISQAPTCGGTCPTLACCPAGQVCGQGSVGGGCDCICPPNTLACPFSAKWGTFGYGDGQLIGPRSIAVDPSGNVFVADPDSLRDRIQKFTSTGTFLTSWGGHGSGDGQFDFPFRIAVDASGNVFVADANNYRIQEFDNAGTFLTKWGSFGSGDGQFNGLVGIAVDAAGDVFALDRNSGNPRIQKFTGTGTFITKWGTGGSGDGEFYAPDDIAVDGSGNVFVADTGNDRIQKFTSAGAFLFKWGGAGIGIGVDASGNVFVAGGSSIQKFDNSGTFVATWGCPGGEDGQFNDTSDVAADGSGNVFVADTQNNRVQKFSCP